MTTANQTEEKKPTKTQTAIDMLRRTGGATIAELSEALSWQRHTVRGFLSATIRKKLNHTLHTAKRKTGENSYFLIS